MKAGSKLSATFLLAALPFSAYADSAPSTGVLFSFGGGFLGGLIGALLACWLCQRGRGSKDQTDTKKY